MISCIIVDQPKELESTVGKLLKSIFHGDDFELNITKDNRKVIYIHNIEKAKVWQTVFNLEVKHISVGYGFGEVKEQAKENAKHRLKIIAEENIH